MKKKSVLLMAVAVMLVAAMSIGGMLAYFTDEDSKTNTFTSGKVGITLTETSVADPENGVNAGTAIENGFSYKIYPGQSYAKAPVITVDSDSEDAYLVAKVTITEKDNLYAAFNSEKAPDGVVQDWGLSLAGAGKLVSGGISDYTAAPATWQGMAGTMLKDSESKDYAFITYEEPEGKDTIVYTYWFINSVTKGQVLPALFTQVNVPAEFDNAEMAKLNGVNIEISAYAVQTVGFTNAKTAYDAAFVTAADEPAGE